MDKQRRDEAQFELDAGVLNPYDNSVPQDREDAVALGILNTLTSQTGAIYDLSEWEFPDRVELKNTIADIVRVGMEDRRVSTRQEDYEAVARGEHVEAQRDQQLGEIALTAHHIGNLWAKQDSDELTNAERVHGAVSGVLSMLQDGYLNVPGFQLVPIKPKDDTPLTIDGHHWSYGKPLSLTADIACASLTEHHASVYDRYRTRFSAAAAELFKVD